MKKQSTIDILMISILFSICISPIAAGGGKISSPCYCMNPETGEIQRYTSGYVYNGYWHARDWEEFVIWEDSFDDGTPMADKYFEYDDDDGDFVPVTSEYFSSPRSMRVIYQQGEDSAGDFKKSFGRTPGGYIGNNAARPTEDFPEIYWRFYVKMEEGWIGSPEKLCRATILANSSWAQAMIAHLWSTSQTTDTLMMDPTSGVDGNGNLVTTRYNDFPNLTWLGAASGSDPIFSTGAAGQWRCVEGHVRLDDPGQSNGIFEFWIDGVLQASRNDLPWVRGWNEYGINCFFIENYWNDGAVRTQERFIDDLVIATERIGCAGGDTTPPDPPTDVTATPVVDLRSWWFGLPESRGREKALR